MVDDPDNLVLVMLRKIDQKIDRMSFDLHDVKVRMTAVEEGLTGIHRRMDRMEDRLDHVEKRLELSGPTTGFAE
jgi:DNA repair ATPase RecN